MMQAREIMNILPHRYPSAQDESSSWSRGRAWASNVTANNRSLPGMAGQLVMPGCSSSGHGSGGRHYAPTALGECCGAARDVRGVDGARFRRPVIPGTRCASSRTDPAQGPTKVGPSHWWTDKCGGPS